MQDRPGITEEFLTGRHGGDTRMNLKTAASRLAVHYQTAYKLVRSGALPAVKIGGTYEISEAALERYQAERASLRAGADAVRATIPAPERDRSAAIAEVFAVAESSTTSAHAVLGTIAVAAAECVGDVCVVRAGADAAFRHVAFHDRDPKRRAALAAIIDDRCFVPGGPSGVFDQVRSTKRSVLVSHVPQDRVRKSIDPQHRQLLDVVGVHSLVIAPVVVAGEVTALVTLNRSTPGAPYGPADVQFAEAMARALQLALERTDAYRSGWQRRRELVDAISERVRSGQRSPADVEHLLRDDSIEVVFDLDASNPTFAASAFANGRMQAVVEELRHATLLGIDDRLQLGDMEFYDHEQELQAFGDAAPRFIVHRGLVTDAVARPRALVVVAHPAPTSDADAYALPHAS
jgi:excisionase family DNA binding protein